MKAVLVVYIDLRLCLGVWRVRYRRLSLVENNVMLLKERCADLGSQRTGRLVHSGLASIVEWSKSWDAKVRSYEGRQRL